MLPRSGASSPAMIRSSVVLPEPDGPSSATNSPRGTSKLTSWSAVKTPKRLLMPSTEMLMGRGPFRIAVRASRNRLRTSGDRHSTTAWPRA